MFGCSSIPAPHIPSFYNTYSGDLAPFADFTSIADNLFTAPLQNGDTVLRHSDAGEATIDVVEVVVGSCSEAPTDFAK